MKTSRLSTLQNILPPVLVAVSLTGIYLGTLAPGLTWANDGSDGGDLITAAATGGVAHPTGYPLYLLLARLIQFLPVGSLAFRTNVMSAIATVLGAVLVYKLVTRSILPSRPGLEWPAGMAAGYAFGLAPLIWSQAVITEVYALQAFLTALILYLYAGRTQCPGSDKKRLDCWRGLVLGLGMGNHVTTILIAPVALLAGSVHRQPEPDGSPRSRRYWLRNLKFDAASLLRQLAWFASGLSLYLILPLRALANPPVNWGNVVTPERLWWLVSGQLYQSYYLQSALPEIWGRIQTGAALLLQQFGLPGIVLGLVGLIVYGASSRLYILTAWTAAIYAAFAVFYRSADSYVYLIPMCLSFAIWIGLGLAGLARQFPRRFSGLGLGLGILLIFYFAARSFTQVSHIDASHDLRAESFGREVLIAAPENAIVFAKGDQAVFALWYLHFALGERPDLAVLATDLLHFDWYQENLRSTYPSLVIPGPFSWPENIVHGNPLRPVCYVQYMNRVEIDCLKPLAAP
jgi:hypothetical protein